MIRTNRAELLRLLHSVDPGRSKRDFIEQSSSFVFRGGRVLTFNDEVFCRAKSGLPKEFTGAVRGAPLLQVLETMTDDDVALSTTESELLVKGVRKRCGIRLDKEIVLPVNEVGAPDEWVPVADPKLFSESIKQVVEAAGTDDEEFLTVCVHVHPDFLEATDRRQGCRFHIPTGVSRSFLVRASSLRHVAALEPTDVGETDQWVHFKNSSMSMSVRRHLEAYPTEHMDKIFAFKGTKIKLPQGVAEAAALGKTFCEGKDNDKVMVTLTGEKMLVRGEGASGFAESDLEMKFSGPAVQFMATPDMLVQLIEKNKECEVSATKLCVRGEKWVYVSTLGRPKAHEPAEAAPVEE